MTVLIIAFLCGSLTCLIVCFVISVLATRNRNDHITATIEETRRRSYAKGYQEGVLHGKGQFIVKHI